MRRGAALVVLVLGLFLAAGCAGDRRQAQAVTLTGAGATFPFPL